MRIFTRRRLIPLLSLLAATGLLQTDLYARNSGDTVAASPAVYVGSSWRVDFTVTSGGGKGITGFYVMAYGPYMQSLASPLGWTGQFLTYGSAFGTEYYALWTTNSRIFSISRGSSISDFSVVVSSLGFPVTWCTLRGDFSVVSHTNAETCGTLTIN